MTSKHILKLFVGIAIAAAVSTVVADEDFDPQPIIEGRQSALRDIGAAFKGINDEFKKSSASLPLIRQYARQIDDLSRQQQRWFPAGTGRESDIETAARPEIWRQPTQFKAGQAAFREQVEKLVQVAAGDDLAAIRSQAQVLGKACKSCHDRFREKDD